MNLGMLCDAIEGASSAAFPTGWKIHLTTPPFHMSTQSIVLDMTQKSTAFIAL
jgi:hypothetical protein